MLLKIISGTKANIFTSILACIQQLNNEVVLRLDKDTLCIQGMDSSHVSMYELKLLKEWFEEFNITESNTYGFSCDIINKILSKRKDKQDICIDFEDETNIKFIFTDDISKKTYTVSSLDVDVETLEVPEQEYDIDIGISSKLFKDIIDELDIFFDDTLLKCDENTVNFIGKNDIVQSNIEIDTENMLSYEYTEEMEMRLSLRYLKIITSISKICNEVLLHLHNESPLRIDFQFDDDHNFKFYLAPKLDE
jgi:proliferating cell nuclear antigen PCNA